MQRRAFCIAVTLLVNQIDRAPVLVRAVPDLAAVEDAAVSTYDARGKTAFPL